MPSYFLPSNDIIFHHLFGEARNQDLLLCLLTAVLAPGKPIVGLTFLPTERLGEGVGEKSSRLDVRVELADGRQVDVEMQNARRPAQLKRGLFYWATMYASGLQSGQSYEQLRRCVVIWLFGYRQLPGERFHSIFRVRELHDQADFSDHLELHTVELPKLPKREGQWPRGSLLAWGRFLGARSPEELREATMNRDPELDKAWQEVERLSRDPATKHLAEKREIDLHMYQIALGGAYREGRAEGRAKGRVEGRVERAVDAVLELLEAPGLSLTEEQRERVFGRTATRAHLRDVRRVAAPRLGVIRCARVPSHRPLTGEDYAPWSLQRAWITFSRIMASRDRRGRCSRRPVSSTRARPGPTPWHVPP